MPQLTSLEEFVKLVEQQKCPSDLVLDFSNSPIQATDLETIVEILSSGQCPSGLKIDLSRNSLGPRGAECIARALKSGNCPHGLQIIFWGNNIGCEGAAVIAEALESGNCPKNLSLDISYNNIGIEGAKHIARAIASGNCPENLILGFGANQIGNEKSILQALENINNSRDNNKLMINLFQHPIYKNLPNSNSNSNYIYRFILNTSELIRKKPGSLLARVTGLPVLWQKYLNRIYRGSDFFVIGRVMSRKKLPGPVLSEILSYMVDPKESTKFEARELSIELAMKIIYIFIENSVGRLGLIPSSIFSQNLRVKEKTDKFLSASRLMQSQNGVDYQEVLFRLAAACYYQRNPRKDTAAMVLSFGLFGLYNRYKYGTFSHQAQSWHEFKKLKILGLEAEHQEIIRKIERDGVNTQSSTRARFR